MNNNPKIEAKGINSLVVGHRVWFRTRFSDPKRTWRYRQELIGCGWW